MAVRTTIDNNALSIKLNRGLKPDGTVQTSSISITGIKKTAFSSEDYSKAMNIVNALADCLEYSIYQVNLTTRVIIDEE